MRNMLFVCAITLASLSANEFIQKRRIRSISLSKCKEDAANTFSSQLRMTAQLIQKIGVLQAKYAKDRCSISKETHMSLNTVATQLRTYSLQLADLLTPCTCSQALHYNETIPITQLLAHITHIIGVIQQHVIQQVEDIFEDKGTVFIKKHRSKLPDVIKMIKIYSKQLCTLQRLLGTLDKKKMVCQQKRAEAMVNHAKGAKKG